MHFSKVFTHVERAEHDLLKSLGMVVFEVGVGGWPRVRVCCDYRSPLRLGDVFEVGLCLEKLGSRSVVWRFVISKDGEELCAEGEMVCVRVDGSGRAVALSDEERGKLEGLL